MFTESQLCIMRQIADYEVTLQSYLELVIDDAAVTEDDEDHEFLVSLMLETAELMVLMN